MLVYVLKRIAYFIPTLIAILIACFVLLEQAPGDPVVSQMQLRGYLDSENNENIDYNTQFDQITKELYLDLPAFYFTIVPNYWANDFYKKVQYKDHFLTKWLLKKTRSFDISYNILQELKTQLSATELMDIRRRPNSINVILKQALDKHESQIYANKFFFPKVLWFGADCRFHQWISQIFTNDFGISKVDGRKIGPKVAKAFKWTAGLVFLTIFISLFLSISLGYISALYPQTLIEWSITKFSFFFYSLPLFWLATILVMFFTTDEYGSWLHIFPASSIIGVGSSTVWSNFISILLPAICLSIHLIAYLIRQIKVSLSEEMSKAYFKTALSKGLDRATIIKKHIFPNALLPLVTIIMGLIPAGLSGSVVLEVIFNIPGMGRSMFDAIFNEDWNMLMAIVLITATITLVFYLIGDLIYAWLNPQIKYA